LDPFAKVNTPDRYAPGDFVVSGNTLETIQDLDQAIEDQMAWIKNNYDKFPDAQTQMDKGLCDPQGYKELSRQLLHLRALLSFTPKEINNSPEKSIFWVLRKWAKE